MLLKLRRGLQTYFIDGQYVDFLLIPVKGNGISILAVLLDNNTGGICVVGGSKTGFYSFGGHEVAHERSEEGGKRERKRRILY